MVVSLLPIKFELKDQFLSTLNIFTQSTFMDSWLSIAQKPRSALHLLSPLSIQFIQHLLTPITTSWPGTPLGAWETKMNHRSLFSGSLQPSSLAHSSTFLCSLTLHTQGRHKTCQGIIMALVKTKQKQQQMFYGGEGYNSQFKWGFWIICGFRLPIYPCSSWPPFLGLLNVDSNNKEHILCSNLLLLRPHFPLRPFHFLFLHSCCLYPDYLLKLSFTFVLTTGHLLVPLPQTNHIEINVFKKFTFCL